MNARPSFLPEAARILGYRCRECKSPTSLSDLNSDMLCTSCGEADEDPEYTLDMSPAAMLRAHGTWGI